MPDPSLPVPVSEKTPKLPAMSIDRVSVVAVMLIGAFQSRKSPFDCWVHQVEFEHAPACVGLDCVRVASVATHAVVLLVTAKKLTEPATDKFWEPDAVVLA